jgi:glycosyltransferase involved in cell wall biosynthesis
MVQTVRSLVIEGWRTSCHSYALVNQQQLLHLLDEPRLAVFHRDMPFFRKNWGSLDSGLAPLDKARLEAISAPPADLRADLTYRIDFPFRIHRGTGRVFVFATREFNRNPTDDSVGADGTPETVEPDAVDIVTPSCWSRQGFLQAGYSPDRVHVIGHGVAPVFHAPLDDDVRARFRQWLQLGDEQFAFLNVSAMTWNKGIGPLLAAFAVHRRTHPQSILVLKGADALYGNYLETSMAEAAALCPEARDRTFARGIRYINETLSADRVACLYRATDAYISPYRAEGFNLPVLEAMAAGLPVIATRGGPTDDFCPDDAGLKIVSDRAMCAAGEYLEPRVESIVLQMQRIVEEPGTRARLGAMARDYVIPRFSWKQVTGKLASLLLGEGPREVA